VRNVWHILAAVCAFLAVSVFSLRVHAEEERCAEVGASRLELRHVASLEPAAVLEVAPETEVAAECDSRGATRVSKEPSMVRRETSVSAGQEIVQDAPELDLVDAFEAVRPAVFPEVLPQAFERLLVGRARAHHAPHGVAVSLERPPRR
jgi:hypothetical protein